jgi:hypothetical protein
LVQVIKKEQKIITVPSEVSFAEKTPNKSDIFSENRKIDNSSPVSENQNIGSKSPLNRNLNINIQQFDISDEKESTPGSTIAKKLSDSFNEI